jgi:pimeloyl-ACP methyl ester carboxylesterase
MAYDMEGEGIPFVFIHQAATNRRLWHHQRNSFYRKYRLITVNVSGHGEVSWPSEEPSIERAADHVQELLVRLKTSPAFWGGVSMGATIAMRMTLSHPLLVRVLILVSPWSHLSASIPEVLLIVYFDWLKRATCRPTLISFCAISSPLCIWTVIIQRLSAFVP